MSEVPPGLVEDPFEHQVTKSGHVRVRRGGREVVVVGGREGERLAAQLAGADEAQTQHLLARATDNYRRGNEKRPHR